MDSSNIKGLVLAGGKSNRMGIDKGDLTYFEKSQKYHVADMLYSLGIQTHISLRRDQVQKLGYDYIVDAYRDIGLMAGILSALEKSQQAWLCVGCDYPTLKKEQLMELLEGRDGDKMATVVFDSGSGYFQPTLGIYEPAMYPILKTNFEQGNYSLQRILQTAAVKKIVLKGPVPESIDTPQEYERTKRKIGRS